MQHSDKEQEEMMEHYRKVFGNIDRDITVNNATAF